MPVKPATQPEPWADAGVYPASVYPPNYPWGDPHPQAGNPTPWSGQPRVNATGLAGFASQGAVPLQAQAGDLWNEEYARVVALTRWVFLGSSAPDEDAHLVETDSAGQASVHTLDVGVPDPGGTAVPFTGRFRGSGPNSDALQAVGTGTGRALLAEGDNGDVVLEAIATAGNTAAIRAEGAGSANSIETTTTGAGAGVDAIATGAGPALRGTGSATSSAVIGVCDAASVEPAIKGTGSTGGANSDGVQGHAANNSAKGVLGQSSASATELVGAGVRAVGLSQGFGLWATSADGVAVYAVGDATSPRRPALALGEQDTDWSVATGGGVGFIADRGAAGKFRLGTQSAIESAHSSIKGWVKSLGVVEAGGPTAGASGNLSLIQVQPEEVGDLLLTVTGDVEFTTSSSTATIQIQDITGGGAIVVAIRTVVAPDRDGVAPERASCDLRGRYTVPDATNRSYVAIITYGGGGGTVSWANVILTGEGTY